MSASADQDAIGRKVDVQKSAGIVCLATDCAVVPKPVPVGGGPMLAMLIICVALIAVNFMKNKWIIKTT